MSNEFCALQQIPLFQGVLPTELVEREHIMSSFIAKKLDIIPASALTIKT